MERGLNLLVNLPGDFPAMAAVFSDARMETIRRNSVLVELTEAVAEAAVRHRKAALAFEKLPASAHGRLELIPEYQAMVRLGDEYLAAVDRLISERDK